MLASSNALVETRLPLPNRRQGKVRDVYDLPPHAGEPRLLIVATDRISAFDVVLPTPIPSKGAVLTDISTRWQRLIEEQGLCATHLRSTSAADVPELDEAQQRLIEGRCTVARACSVVPIECVARGHLAGSGWAEYQRSGSVCGVSLPAGLKRGQKLPEPIFTPATKAEQGEHDENITFEQACRIAGEPLMRRLRDLTLQLYRFAYERARARGLILADTKFEFGAPLPAAVASDPEAARSHWRNADPDEFLLVDEALTPDSSRYWPADRFTPGAEPEPFDKQFVRNHLLELVERGLWNKQPPGPALPDEVVARTIERYEKARQLLFGD